MKLKHYTGLMRLVLPLALARLYWRSVRSPAYRTRIGERLALTSVPAPRTDIWIHAVSVGEVQAAAPLVRHLLARIPPPRILMTTTTPTGANRVRELFGERVAHRYLPFDLPSIVGRFLAQTQPHCLIVMETEIWPNLLVACAERGISTVLANARLSAQSARGYARLPQLTQFTLAHFTVIAAQTTADAERFIALGAHSARVHVMGNLKFEQSSPPKMHEQAATLREHWGGAARPVWVAASTHEGEESLLLNAHRRLRMQLPNALLVLVPRHPERFDRVATLISRQNLPFTRRSVQTNCDAEIAVFLGDSMGELPLLLAASDVAFIGGSLVAVGGHNPLEAAAVAVPVIVGPHTFNFAAITEGLIAAGAAIRVNNAEALAQQLQQWLMNTALRVEMGARGQRMVMDNRGALTRLVEILNAVTASSAVTMPMN
ncbi:3-deoxy-D-manno-octulosonic acid transferase [Chromatium weissei]|nr:3-deoxy-D-manno-octulosonic acid transferase [Chromatium weissei]